jgi:hypothetical protein
MPRAMSMRSATTAAGGRTIARARALKQQATGEIAFNHRIGRAINMGQQIVERHQMRRHALEQTGAPSGPASASAVPIRRMQ